MRTTSIFVSATVLAVSAFMVVDANADDHRGGVSTASPGHQMQSATTSTGPGASELSPGDQMRDTRGQGTSTTTTTPGTTAPGASGFAPGDRISHGRR